MVCIASGDGRCSGIGVVCCLLESTVTGKCLKVCGVVFCVDVSSVPYYMGAIVVYMGHLVEQCLCRAAVSDDVIKNCWCIK